MSQAVMDTQASAADVPARRDIGLKRRYAAEQRFRAMGIAAIAFGVIFLVILLGSIVSKGYTAFVQTAITIPVNFSADIIDKGDKRASDPKVLVTANYPQVARLSLAAVLGVDPSDSKAMKQVSGMVSDSVRGQLRAMV